MRIEYTDLDFTDLRGETLADHLISVEASLFIRDGLEVVYEEPCFPVVELARSMSAWLEAQPDADFVFESLSFESPGAVTLIRSSNGWVIGSRLTPHLRSSSRGWLTVERCVTDFIASVRTDLLKKRLDADKIVPLWTVGRAAEGGLSV